MGKIIVLDENTANQIAAGEVVERPASIVKELVENSIDANADHITIQIQKGGISSITISDNGEGMLMDDLAMAFERHSTSKIKRAEDLLRINSFGFRGEALASIASVSKVTMISRTKNTEYGSQIKLEGGRILDISKTSCNYGTTIIVQDLFYNVPARFKFLKNDSTEASHINDVLSKTAVANPGISFEYTSSARSLFITPGNNDQKSAIYSIYGKEAATKLLEVDFTTGNYKINGYIADPSFYKKNRDMQLVFLNKRYVKSKLFIFAIDKAYEEQHVKGRYAAVFLNILVDPSLIDINVHPQKLEVRFSDEKSIYNLIYHGIKNSLEAKPVYFKSNASFTKSYTAKEKPNQNTQEFTQVLINDNIADTDVSEMIKSDLQIKPKSAVIKEPDKSKKMFSELIKDALYKGQLFNTYILFEKADMLLLLDQHAAHERINYERIIDLRKEGISLRQSLLEPLSISLSNQEMIAFLANKDFISEIGYEIEEFGENTILIRAIPSDKDQSSIKDSLLDILSEIRRHNYDITDENIAMIACRTSIKANMKLDITLTSALLSKLEKTRNPLNCPHGRTVLQVISKKDLEKMFQRRL